MGHDRPDARADARASPIERERPIQPPDAHCRRAYPVDYLTIALI